MIHDAQYTLAEYPAKLGWGHSHRSSRPSTSRAPAGVKRLALFHHDPGRDDAAVDALLAVCQARARDQGTALEVFAAAEGEIVEIVPRAPLETATGRPERAADRSAPADDFVADDDIAVLEILSELLESEGFRVVAANDGARALALARAERPDLVLLDWTMPGMTGLEVCRAIRSGSDVGLRSVPVILITARDEADDTAASFGSGVSDYLTKPFKTTLVLARVHAWLLQVAVTEFGYFSAVRIAAGPPFTLTR